MRLRFNVFIIFFSLFPFISSLHADETLKNTVEKVHTWVSYPQTLPQFDYSNDLLQKNWPQLSAGIQLPWPDSIFIKDMMKKFPLMSIQLKELASKPDSHPALSPTLNQNFLPLALAVQQVWRLHYQGQYQQAYELGMKLGPAGLLPALYAKLIHTTFFIDNAHKYEKFLEVNAVTEPLMQLYKGFDFLTFCDAYQKARRLELLSTTAASASGLLSQTQEALQTLHKKSPQHPLYSVVLAGIDAGIIERVGGFLGGMTYGADEDRVIELFEEALIHEKRLAVIYNEYTQALIRLDDSDYEVKLETLLKTCVDLPAHSAEEALNQQACAQSFEKRRRSNNL